MSNLANISTVNSLPDLLVHEVCALGDTVKLEELGNFIRKRKIDVDLADEECGDRVALHWAASKGKTVLSIWYISTKRRMVFAVIHYLERIESYYKASQISLIFYHKVARNWKRFKDSFGSS